MRVLVSGGAGFIGSNLAIELENAGHEVIAVDNFISGDRNNLKGFKGQIIEADASNQIKNPIIIEGRLDAIFHEAAITDTTFKDDVEMYRQNICGFLEMLKLAMKNGSKLIYASSAGVYGNGAVPMRENQKLQPLNAYAHSKKEVDEIAERFFDKLNIVGLRYFNVFGPNEGYKGKSSSMICQLAVKMKKGIRPRIFIDGEQKRDHIYVMDVVKAAILALKAKKSGIYNVGTGIATTFNELIEELNDALGTRLEPEYFENTIKDAYQNNTQADTKKTEKDLGFKAEYSLKRGIEEYTKILGLN